MNLELQNLLDITDDLKTMLLKDIGRTNEDVNESVKILLEWFSSEPHLKHITPDPRHVRTVYQGSKGSIERSKQVLDMYYSVKGAIPEVFSERDPLLPEIKQVLETAIYIPMRPYTPEGYRVVCVTLIDTDPNKFDLCSLFKYIFMLGEIRYRLDHNIGEVIIFNCSQFKLGHIAKLAPASVKKIEVAAQKAYMSRLKALHFLSSPGITEKLFQILRQALSPKLKSRLFIHSNFESVHKVVDKKLLPSDFGGELKSLKEMRAEWYDLALKNRDWYLKSDTEIPDESKRPGKPVIDELLGIQGSFRKLTVD